MDVISKLRLKFIVTIAIILTVVFSLIFGFINLISTRSTENQIRERLQELVDDDGGRFLPNMIYRLNDGREKRNWPNISDVKPEDLQRGGLQPDAEGNDTQPEYEEYDPEWV